jgi:glyoxylase I family protein
MAEKKSFTESAHPVNFRVEHLGLPARDPVALKDWYARMLGAKMVFCNGQTPPAFLLALPGQIMIEIYGGDLSLPQTSNNKLNGWRHVALRVDSLAAAKAELEERGLKFTDEIKPAGGGGSVLFFQDPEGNLLHLVERAADSSIC